MPVTMQHPLGPCAKARIIDALGRVKVRPPQEVRSLRYSVPVGLRLDSLDRRRNQSHFGFNFSRTVIAPDSRLIDRMMAAQSGMKTAQHRPHLGRSFSGAVIADSMNVIEQLIGSAIE